MAEELDCDDVPMEEYGDWPDNWSDVENGNIPEIGEELHKSEASVYLKPLEIRCSVCNNRLSSWYFERDGSLYCRQDYLAKFGESCNGCAQIIIGPVMLAGEHKYHPDCFICIKCGTFIGDGDGYALVERSKLYCGNCYHSILVPIIATSPASCNPHTVQLVTIPPTPDGQKRFSVSVEETMQYPATPTPEAERIAMQGLCVKEIDSSPAETPLRVGDRILEVNGTPVRKQNMYELDRLISQSTTELQLTIEHDPVTQTRTTKTTTTTKTTKTTTKTTTTTSTTESTESTDAPPSSSQTQTSLEHHHSTAASRPCKPKTLNVVARQQIHHQHHDNEDRGKPGRMEVSLPMTRPERVSSLSKL